MRFPRNTKIFRGQLDAAPYAGVLFLLVIFLILNSSFIFIPGVPIRLPEAPPLPGPAQPSIAVVLDEQGRFYFDNQVANSAQLEARLREAVAKARTPLTLVIQADEKVTYKMLTEIWLIARAAGITDLFQAVRPPLKPGEPPSQP